MYISKRILINFIIIAIFLVWALNSSCLNPVTSSECTNRGTCVSNNCECNPNYYGNYCQFTNCTVENPGEGAIFCSGYGTCIDDACVCVNSNFTSDYCEISKCQGVWNNETGVCSGHGSCINSECVCDELYIGDNCSYVYCWDRPSNDSLVCSGNGVCLSPNNCSCNENYFGDQCQFTSCNGVFSNETDLVCSGHGSCSSYNLCSCFPGYDFSDPWCSNFTCAPDTITPPPLNECYGHGTCVGANNCSCNSTDYYGNTCQYKECGVIGPEFECSGFGSCNDQNHCECYGDAFVGKHCENLRCYLDPFSTCSGHGLCASSECYCIPGYQGLDCELYSCYGKLYTDSDVCYSGGTCKDVNQCECFPGRYGDDCKFSNCSIANETSVVCSGHGSCNGIGNCSCFPGFTGDICQYPICDDIPSYNSSVCNGRGSCQLNGICECQNGFAGSYCEYKACNSISEKHYSVCSGHGKCIDSDNCTCQTGYSGQFCDVFDCYKISSKNSTVCNAHGTCTSIDVCSCATGWTGTQCNTLSCFGIAIGANACSGRGSCTGPNSCTCSTGYSGNICQFPQCNGISANMSTVCSSHGQCVEPNTCVCQEGYTGQFCQNYQCFCEHRNSSTVCSGHGVCESANLCVCDEHYSGINCEFSICNLKPSEDPNVCSGHGVCSSFNNCTCEDGYVGPDCEYPICYGQSQGYGYILPCNGNGDCVAPNTCKCNGKYRNANCSDPYCFDEWHKDLVCSGHGTCKSADNCSCASDYTGDKCQYRNSFLLTIDVASFRIQNADDYRTSAIKTAKPFFIFGELYQTIKVSVDGVITFIKTGTGTYTGRTSTLKGYTGQDAAIFLSHTDLDTRVETVSKNNTVYYRETLNPPTTAQMYELNQLKALIQKSYYSHQQYSLFNPDWFFVLSYNNVGYFPKKVDKLNNIQLIIVTDSTRNMTFTIFNTKLQGIQYPVLDPSIGIVAPYDSINDVSKYINLMNIADPLSGLSSMISQQSNVNMPGIYIFPTHEKEIADTVELTQWCDGIYANYSSVCSGHGTCIAKDVCSCQKGYKGSNCEISCISETNWMGDYCNVPVCFGKVAYDPEVCSGHGVCTAPNTCKCNTYSSGSYYGSQCGDYNCYNYYYKNSAACTGNGKCIAPNTCECYPGYKHNFATNERSCEVASCAPSNLACWCNKSIPGNLCGGVIRYVSVYNGTDANNNNCTSNLNPCKTIEYTFGISKDGDEIQLLAGGVYILPLYTIYLSKSVIFNCEKGKNCTLSSSSYHNSLTPHFGILHEQYSYEVRFKNLNINNIKANVFLEILCTKGAKAIFTDIVANAQENPFKLIFQNRGSMVEIHNSTFLNFPTIPISVFASTKNNSDYVYINSTIFRNFNMESEDVYREKNLKASVMHIENIYSVTLLNLTISGSKYNPIYIKNADDVVIRSVRIENSVSNGTSGMEISSTKLLNMTIITFLNHNSNGSLIHVDKVNNFLVERVNFTNIETYSGLNIITIILMCGFF